jgi:hypothetical protein
MMRVELENQRDRINNEIGLYPTPIAGCDQQFNYLLEQRSGISAKLRRMQEAENQSLSDKDLFKVLDDFIRSSNTIEKGAGSTIRRFMAEALSSLQD